MVIPMLFIHWLSIAVLIAIGPRLIVFVLFKAEMNSLLAAVRD